MRIKPCIYFALIFGFLLGIENGFIALWRDNAETPLKTFPYRAEFLPEADQKALSQGIHIESETELQQLLEDYLS